MESTEDQLNAVREDIFSVTGLRRVDTMQDIPPLDGHPWCAEARAGPEEALQQEAEMLKLYGASASSNVTSLEAVPPRSSRRVALLFHGEAFRARNFFKRTKLDCGEGTKDVQQQIVANHLSAIVEPIEELGFAAEIFLAHTPCCLEHRHGHLEPNDDPLGSLDLLRSWYGERVMGATTMDLTTGMYAKLGLALLWLQEAVLARGPYEYYVVWRFDVSMDVPFSSLLRTREAPHNGLSFFIAAHDFMFALPGEMWNCMWQFWVRCVTYTSGMGLDTVDLDDRSRHECFTFGPVQLEPWYESNGFRLALYVIQKAVSMDELTKTSCLDKSGTTAFDVNGDDHTCMNGWYWPPLNTLEDRFMPYFFHVGPHQCRRR